MCTKTTCTTKAVQHRHPRDSRILAVTWFITASLIGCMKVSILFSFCGFLSRKKNLLTYNWREPCVANLRRFWFVLYHWSCDPMQSPLTGYTISNLTETYLHFHSWTTRILLNTRHKTNNSTRPIPMFSEEIFHSHVTHWWSTDSSYICYTQIDDSQVPAYTFPWYGEQSHMYGSFMNVAYPKV